MKRLIRQEKLGTVVDKHWFSDKIRI